MECVFCKKTRDLFSITIRGDEETYTQHVCGSCWEAVVEIANRAIKSEIDEIKERLKSLEERR